MPYRDDGVGYRAEAETSRAAMPVNAGTLRAAAFAALKVRPQNTDELARTLADSTLAIRPRVTELRNAGLVFDSGIRRPMRSGKTGIVWTTIDPSKPPATLLDLMGAHSGGPS